jgi:DNA-binding MarR family transcriptional regulator
LRPSGLRTTQFTILQVLSSVEEATQGQLGKILAMDSTTLTRTLQIMARRRWIAERPGRDRRERWLRLARAGRLRLERALPDWEKVQTPLRARLGEERWPALIELTDEMTSIVTK